MCRAEGASGYGSTNTVIRRWSSSTTEGTAITFSNDSTAGSSFTINEAGVYGVSYTDQLQSASIAFGISLNSTQLTTSILGITASDRLGSHHTAASHYSGCVSTTVRLKARDVLRPHVDTGATVGNTPALCMFTVTQLYKL